MKILITSGGTQVPLDSVRHIGNMSSGRFGSQLAQHLLEAGHKIAFFRQIHSHSPFKLEIDLLGGAGAEKKIAEGAILIRAVAHRVEKLLPLRSAYQEQTFLTYTDYAHKLPAFVKDFQPDIVVAAAAVSDYETEPHPGKMPSSSETVIRLRPTAKVLPFIKPACPTTKLVGFKLLVDPSEKDYETAVARVMASGPCDMVAANDLTELRTGRHNYRFYFPNGESKPLPAGSDLAKRFALEIEALGA